MDNKDYASLTVEEKHQLIHDSLALMRTLTELWGSHAGILLWEKISEAIGNDAKGEIFFGMMTGKYMPGVVFVKTASPTDFIQMIKDVRTATGFGLKEAKDFCDHVKNKGPQKIECGDRKTAELLARKLEAIGCEVDY